MKLSLILFVQFIKIGLFAIGGGYATLPFLYELSSIYHWFCPGDLTQMLAIASMMPGPIGINLASQSGFKAFGVWGAFLAVSGIMVPSLIFVFIISKILKEFKGNRFVHSILSMLKPTSCAMVVAIGCNLLKDVVFKQGACVPTVSSIDWVALALFATMFVISLKKNMSPMFYLGVSAIVGVIVKNIL